MRKLALILLLFICAGASQAQTEAQTQPDTLSDKAYGFHFYLPIEKSRWYTHEEVEITNAPGTSYRFYFSLNLGLGAIYSEKEISRRYP